MNKDQFIYWLKGFVDAAEVSPTQIQWKLIKEKLDDIKDCPDYGSPIGEGGWGTPNITPLWQEPHYPNQLDKYKITCDTGVVSTNGSTGAITTDALKYSRYTPGSPGTTSITTTSNEPVTYTINDSKDSKN